jgi:site-specific DNA recombinase
MFRFGWGCAAPHWVVHSFSRFFRNQFQLEFYGRRMAKNGMRLVSIMQELGDDPVSNVVR